MSKRLIFILIGIAMLFLATPALAQESPPVVETTFIENLIRLISDATFVPFLASGVIVLTSVVRWLLDRAGVDLSPALVALIVQVVVWAAYTLARSQGIETQFTSIWEAIIRIVEALWPLVGSLAISHWGYEKARAAGNPFLGYH